MIKELALLLIVMPRKSVELTSSVFLFSNSLGNPDISVVLVLAGSDHLQA